MRKYLIIGIVLAALALAGIIGWNSYSHRNDDRWQKATDYYKKGDYENAKKQLRGVPVPGSADRLRIYGQTMLATRDLDKALTAYKRLYEINKDSQTQLVIGNIYNEKKQYDEAIKIYNQAISTNPNNTQAYVNLATLYKMQNNLAEATRVANDGVKNNPGSITLHELQVSMLLNDRNTPEFKAAVESLKKLNPDSAMLKSVGA